VANLDINKSLGLKKYRLTKIDLPFLFLLKNGTRMIWAERQNSYDPPSGWLCTVGNKWGFGPLSTAFWRRRERGCQKPRLLACPNKCLSRIKTVTKTGRFELSEWCSLPGEQKKFTLSVSSPSSSTVGVYYNLTVKAYSYNGKSDDGTIVHYQKSDESFYLINSLNGEMWRSASL